MVSKMKVYYHFLLFISILNPGGVISESAKGVKKSNISINKGKWHVGRVSRKQYEIINMLWRKTKIFIDTGTTKVFQNNSLKDVDKLKRHKNSQHVTLVNRNPLQESFQLAHPKSKVYSSTSSYIEFYYLDELDGMKMKRSDNTVKTNNKAVTKSDVFEKMWKTGFSRSPFFLFRVNEATCKTTTLSPIFSHQFVKWATLKTPTSANHQKKTKTLKSSRRDKIHETAKSVRYFKTRGKITSTLSLPTKNIKNGLLKQEIYKSSNKEFPDTTTSVSKTTTAVNDHIRFFDIYDSYVDTPFTFIDGDEDQVNRNTIQNEKKINLNDVDHNTKQYDKNKTKYVKKYVNQNKDYLRGYKFYNQDIKDLNLSPNPTINTDHQSHLALWSDFPFVGVYVYEPTQVRCDSASISPHWLVASASCLNRHHRNIKAEGRSAFVTYCSDNWRHPGRIAYVKQSLIHPRFHPKDKLRRQLYNIGAIQVVNSMADTCNGWAPISLMSHQFSAARDGTLATALGWGLDRYDTHSMNELPKQLSFYKGLVYSNSCPGTTGYSNAKREGVASIKNVYCLSLPSYIDEENDPVHGSLLLIGGKLIALYMQEARRKHGNQSAQYTGIWHLIPWLLDVAREPDELDPFHLEM